MGAAMIEVEVVAGVGIVGVVAMAVGKLQSAGREVAFELHLDVAVLAPGVVVGGRVGEGVVVGAGVDGLADGGSEAVGVVEGVAAGVFGDLLHRHVLLRVLLVEGGDVAAHFGRVTGIAFAGAGSVEHGQGLQAARVDGINGDTGAIEQAAGLAKLIAGIRS